MIRSKLSILSKQISKYFNILCDILENEGRWKYYARRLFKCRKRKKEKKFYVVE